MDRRPTIMHGQAFQKRKGACEKCKTQCVDTAKVRGTRHKDSGRSKGYTLQELKGTLKIYIYCYLFKSERRN